MMMMMMMMMIYTTSNIHNNVADRHWRDRVLKENVGERTFAKQNSHKEGN